MSNVARAGISLAVGIGAGVLTVLVSWAAKQALAMPSVPAAS
jgi:hypothetical protein